MSKSRITRLKEPIRFLQHSELEVSVGPCPHMMWNNTKNKELHIQGEDQRSLYSLSIGKGTRRESYRNKVMLFPCQRSLCCKGMFFFFCGKHCGERSLHMTTACFRFGTHAGGQSSGEQPWRLFLSVSISISQIWCFLLMIFSSESPCSSDPDDTDESEWSVFVVDEVTIMQREGFNTTPPYETWDRDWVQLWNMLQIQMITL